ncbi:hypothetical protein N7462_004493 [Penicillium macrosclerotiorum]|uniref:uncharacterized protein n=1 Tax=Penicillium macrosclerotiorum TaxID=303699 RepID=UPI0025473238|nr:uncharacterized protein N7462_004493 [Penicillium macrosclerotiorum]KAJ5690101.1 hypothetical protein N7462_004493 [Penicillium macrosclerotiorum]
MTLFRSLFRPNKSESDRPSRPRHPWLRPRRSQSELAVLNGRSEPAATAKDTNTTLTPTQSEPSETSERSNLVTYHHPIHGAERSYSHDDRILPDNNPLIGPGHPPESVEPQELSRSQPGSRRLRNLMSRLRLSRSHDQSSVSEEPTPSALQGAREITKEETKAATTAQEPLSQNQPNVEPEQNRNVSAQTVQSHESSNTTIVYRPSSPRIPLSVQELGGDLAWDDLLNFDQDSGHLPEISDPFSDSKNSDPHHRALTSSRYSEEAIRKSEASRRSHRHSETESSTLANSHTSSQHRSQQDSHSPHSSHHLSTQRNSSGSSQSSRNSRMSRLDPSKATVAFNMLAGKLNVALSIPTDDLMIASSEDPAATQADSSILHRRHRFLGRVRPVQSNAALGETSQPPSSKLRRAKTFASFARRPEPMVSLRGKSIETLARLGGHSFIILSADLAPCPLQLPACIVATVMYLRRFGLSAAELFLEPGDLKSAINLYDHFASQVLSAEKEESKIAMTMRVVAMPHWEDDAEPVLVLSVGWTLKALLSGLPGGILGSPRLYQTLRDICHTEGIPVAGRVRLITLAIVALTSEMQCALLCAIFGLLTGLLQEPASPELALHPHQPQAPAEQAAPGTVVRPVASVSKADRLARVFGPLLIGTGPRDHNHAVQPNPVEAVEQEIAEDRVAGMLLEHWRSVSRNLRDWASAPSRGAMGKRE